MHVNNYSDFQQEPKTQHLLIDNGAFANFSCLITNAISAYWNITFPNGTVVYITEPRYNQDGIFAEIIQLRILQLRISARLSYNNTRVICAGYDGTGNHLSDPPAYLLIHQTLRKI